MLTYLLLTDNRLEIAPQFQWKCSLLPWVLLIDIFLLQSLCRSINTIIWLPANWKKCNNSRQNERSVLVRTREDTCKENVTSIYFNSLIFPQILECAKLRAWRAFVQCLYFVLLGPTCTFFCTLHLCPSSLTCRTCLTETLLSLHVLLALTRLTYPRNLRGLVRYLSPCLKYPTYLLCYRGLAYTE